jgi:hypothetical protein
VLSFHGLCRLWATEWVGWSVMVSLGGVRNPKHQDGCLVQSWTHTLLLRTVLLVISWISRHIHLARIHGALLLASIFVQQTAIGAGAGSPAPVARRKGPRAQCELRMPPWQVHSQLSGRSTEEGMTGVRCGVTL